MAKVAFDDRLREGKMGEGIIARWLMSRGYSVLPVYEIEKNTGKGPVIYTDAGNLVAPDMLAYNLRGAKWIEAKTKSSFTWHRITERWVTGVDLRHYCDYLKVAESSPWPIWILFLHTDRRGALDTPDHLVGKSPVGLFGNHLLILSKRESHRHTNWGKSGMVYWARDNLKLLADYQPSAQRIVKC